MNGLVGGEKEPKDSVLTFTIDVTIPKDENKQYRDAEIKMAFSAEGFSDNGDD